MIGRWYGNDSKMIGRWYGDDTEMIRRWFGEDTKMIRRWYGDDTEMIRRWYGDDTEIVRRRYEDNTEMMRRWYEDDTKMIWRWFGDDTEMFSIDVNDLPLAPRSCPTESYVDDTKLYISFPAHDWAKAVADLNVDLLHIRNWWFENRLLLNLDKTKLIVHGSRQRLQNLPDILLSLLGKELIPAHVVKDLGVTSDSSLTFHEHIMKTVSSCFSSSTQINRVKHVFDRSTLTTIINTLVFSKLFYCSSVWSNVADANLLKL